MNYKELRDRLIKSINTTVDESQTLGAEDIAAAIIDDIPELVNKNALLHGVSHRTWSVDEIVEELKDIDAFDAAKYFFDKYGG